MQTNEETLENITALLNSYINDQAITQTQCISEIQSIIEEQYIHGSLDNNYK
jgi:hypothetical protein